MTAAAVLNPGGAAWKTIGWEGQLTAGGSALILGATGASGRIAAQLAIRIGARVVVAGRNQDVLDDLVKRGADSAIRVDRDGGRLVDEIAAAGPFDLVADYLWGQPAEATLAALGRAGGRDDRAPERIRYVSVGMAAGEVAAVPAVALRRAPVEIVGSGTGRPASLGDFAAAYRDLLHDVATGAIDFQVRAVPLADVEKVWTRPDDGNRIVLVP